MEDNRLKDTVWIMKTIDGYWYPIQPSTKCKPEDHGNINDHLHSIEDMMGNILWRRAFQ